MTAWDGKSVHLRERGARSRRGEMKNGGGRDVKVMKTGNLEAGRR